MITLLLTRFSSTPSTKWIGARKENKNRNETKTPKLKWLLVKKPPTRTERSHWQPQQRNLDLSIAEALLISVKWWPQVQINSIPGVAIRPFSRSQVLVASRLARTFNNSKRSIFVLSLRTFELLPFIPLMKNLLSNKNSTFVDSKFWPFALPLYLQPIRKLVVCTVWRN